MRINKTELVQEWWNGCIDAQTQMWPLNADKHEELKREGMVRPAGVMWYERIATDALWLAFRVWLENNYPTFKGQYTKVGFMMMFPKLTKVEKCRLSFRDDKGKEIHDAPALRFINDPSKS